jgi:uncharacterized SAM-binding protein YcdF (DUF218 family)
MDSQTLAFWAAKLAGQLVLPPIGPLAAALLGLMLIRRFPRTGRALALTGVGSLAVLSVPVVASLLMFAVTDARPLPPSARIDAQAIVVLGAGTRPNAPEYGGETLTSMTLERVRYGAVLAKRTGLPVAVAGGAVYDGRPEAEVMSDALATEFGVTVRWREGASRNTHQNARYLAKILLPEGVKRIAVVTHGVDTRRARRELEAAGFTVIPAPTVAPPFSVSSVWDFVPSMLGLRASYLALYEILGNLKATWDGLP